MKQMYIDVLKVFIFVILLFTVHKGYKSYVQGIKQPFIIHNIGKLVYNVTH